MPVNRKKQAKADEQPSNLVSGTAPIPQSIQFQGQSTTATESEPVKYNEFTVACAEAIVEILRGETPSFPPDLEVPSEVEEFFRNLSKIEDSYIDEFSSQKIVSDWPYYALIWWVKQKLSYSMKRIFKERGINIVDVAYNFLAYLNGIDPNKEYSEDIESTTQPHKVYILGSRYPASALPTWFGRFITSHLGPFGRTLTAKLKERFDDVLKGADFNVDNRKTDRLSPTEIEIIAEEYKECFGQINPKIYDSEDKEDPIISKEDALKVSEFVREKTLKNPSTWDLAKIAEICLPPDIWVKEVPVLPENNDVDDDINKPIEPTDPKAEENIYDGVTDISEEKIREYVLMIIKSPELDIKDLVVAAGRLSENPMKLREIKDWMEKHLEKKDQLRVSAIQRRARGDALEKNEDDPDDLDEDEDQDKNKRIIEVIETLCEKLVPNDIWKEIKESPKLHGSFYAIFSKEARKFLEDPSYILGERHKDGGNKS